MRVLLVFFSLFLLFSHSSYGQMDVMLQGWYWDYPKTPNGHLWADTLDQKATELAEAGFTYIWLPPLSRASFGNNSNGYDPKDLYDLGEYGGGATGFGTRQNLDDLITNLNSLGIKAVADVVYNHRDGGKAEENSALKDYINTYDWTKANTGYNPFPYDRWQCYIPLGGTSGNEAGHYYFKVSSSSDHSRFDDYEYNVYMQTHTVGWQNLPDQVESEPNGGGDCSQANNDITLGVNMNALNDDYGGCDTDEFHLELGPDDYNPDGDTLFIFLDKRGSGYSDLRVYGIWSANLSTDIIGDLAYRTYTDFTAMPSNQGEMNFQNFKPNSTNTTKLEGDWDYPWFFYDYDQNIADTRQKLIDWSKWLWDDVNIRGFRMDAVKHFDPLFVSALLDDLYSDGKLPEMIVGEYYENNPWTLLNWVNTVENNLTPAASNDLDVRIFDFGLRQALKNACDAFGYDVRNIFTSGIVDGASGSGFNVVTFVGNHDFREGTQAVQNDPLLPYVYILTNNKVGLPCVFYPDYYGTEIPDSPGDNLKNHIDKLIGIHNQYILGATDIEYLSRFSTPYYFDFHEAYASTTLVYQIIGGGGDPNREIIVAINFAGEDLDVTFDLSNNSQLDPGDQLLDLVGNTLTPTVTLDANSYARISIPPRSYGIWANSPAAICDDQSVIYVRAGNNNLNDGKNWNHAFSELSAALLQARLCPNISEIWISEGSYYPNVLNDRGQGFDIPPGVSLIGGFPNTGNPGMNDRNVTNYPTILSGDIGILNDAADNVYHVISTAENSLLSTLDGLYVKYGTANGTGEMNLGGGLYNKGNLGLAHCYFENNFAGDGAAVYNSGTNGKLRVTDCQFVSNDSELASAIVNSGDGQIIVEGNTQIDP